MSTEFYFHLVQTIRNKAVSWVTAFLALSLFFTAPFQKSQPLRTSLYLMALVAANLCLLTDESTKENEQAIKDFYTGSILNRQRALVAVDKKTEIVEVAAEAVPAIENKPRFSFHTIGNDRDKFPNVFILGEPGSGKTTLAQYLGVELDSDCRVAVHPHAKPSDFPGFQLVLGGGRNIGTPKDKSVTWADIMGKRRKPTIAQVVMALYQLMIDRYEVYFTGETSFPTIDVYFDELPAISTTLGKGFLKEYLPQLIMECRKIGIRLWFLTQSYEVESLGLEGNSSLREGATFIRLGNLALKHARTLMNSKQITQADYTRLQSTARPCMVDDEIVELPVYEKMAASVDAKRTKATKTRARKTKST